MSSAVVLFDLDDTLTDAAQFGASVLASAAGRHGHALAVEAIQAYPGVRYEPLLVQLLHLAPPEASAIYATYIDLYRDMMPGGLREHPGATELLRALAARDVPVGLVTNKLDALAHEIVELLGWSSLIRVIVGQDTGPYHKPDPAVVRYALDGLGGSAEAATLVGDTVDDMTGASGAGVARIIGLLTTTPGDRLIAAGATQLCASLDEVRAIVAPD